MAWYYLSRGTTLHLPVGRVYLVMLSGLLCCCRCYYIIIIIIIIKLLSCLPL
jgi:hypothetical protein